MINNHLIILEIILVGGTILAVWTAWLTRKIRDHALRIGMLDIPNERSSHTVPTPRGGGLAIVINVLAGVFIMALVLKTNIPWLWILLVGGLLVVGVGWLDDRFSLKPIIRLMIHILAALVIVLWIGSNLEIVLQLVSLRGPFAYAFIILFTVWNINAYNFMDGMDGQAASQAVIVSVIAGLLAYINGNLPLAFVYFLVGASCLGFLKLNWQPARIFLGDLGSGFLGMTFAVLALWGKQTKAVPFPAFFILMAVFYVDATYTALRRLVAGENITKPHHDFAFQHALELGYSHAQVTGFITAINVFWLAPLAWWSVLLRSNWSSAVMVLAYIPLIAGAIILKAGERINPKKKDRQINPKKKDRQINPKKKDRHINPKKKDRQIIKSES